MGRLLPYSPLGPCKASVGSPALAAWLPSHPSGCSSVAGQGLTASLELARQRCQQMPVIEEEDSRDYVLQAAINKKAGSKNKIAGTHDLVLLICMGKPGCWVMLSLSPPTRGPPEPGQLCTPLSLGASQKC